MLYRKKRTDLKNHDLKVRTTHLRLQETELRDIDLIRVKTKIAKLKIRFIIYRALISVILHILL